MEHHLFHRSSYDGGMASFLKTTARAVVKLDPSLGRPKDIAALADAGLTAYHAVKKSIPDLYPGTKVMSHPEFWENSSNIRKDDKARIVSKFGG
jgi:D-arabinose 1-dehydrogenase-like Zn-dependent alcohol dehydrogenase